MSVPRDSKNSHKDSDLFQYVTNHKEAKTLGKFVLIYFACSHTLWSMYHLLLLDKPHLLYDMKNLNFQMNCVSVSLASVTSVKCMPLRCGKSVLPS